MPGRYSVLSLYSGAGGLDCGFRDAGFDLLWAIDNDRHAVKTYNANLGPHAVCGELPAMRPPADLRPDVLIGGPPCQGFSVAGRMDAHDRRSHHVLTYFRFVEEYRPKAFVMENVKALATSGRWAPIRRQLLKRAKRLGYSVEVFVLNAADYGVPQARERMFMVGLRDGIPLCPVTQTKGSPPTVGETLRALAPYGTSGNDTYCTAKIVPAKSPVLRPSAFKGSLLFNGWGRPLDLSQPAKTLPASMGGNATPIVDQAELACGEASWVHDYHDYLIRGGAPASHAPSNMRRLSLEEAAALQTFPPGWTFYGPKGTRFRQIGNSVPPQLGRMVAISVCDALDAGRARAVTVAPRGSSRVPASLGSA